MPLVFPTASAVGYARSPQNGAVSYFGGSPCDNDLPHFARPRGEADSSAHPSETGDGLRYNEFAGSASRLGRTYGFSRTFSA
jgi:hypothetical protein